MCTLKSPVSQVMSSTPVKVFFGTKRRGGYSSPCSTNYMYVMGGGFSHSNLPQGKGGMQQEALDFRSLDQGITVCVCP